MRAYLFLCFVITSLLVTVLPSSAFAEFNPIELISEPNDDPTADEASTRGNIAFSSSGRYVVFDSAATNLITNDDNGVQDVFLVDRNADDGSKVSLISVDKDGGDANGASGNASVSADGQYVVFESAATDLVTDDENGATDIFLRDTVNDTTTRISLDTDGNDSNGNSSDARISSDGNFVVFVSEASDLVLNDDNGAADVFLYDRVNDTITRISVDSDELEVDNASSNPSINSDGTLVVFDSIATDLVANDTNGLRDVFLRNVTSGTTTILSNHDDGSASDGISVNPFISDDGTLVAFQSAATGLITDDDNGNTDIFLYTLADDSVVRASGDGDGDSANPVISGDGGFVIFESSSTDIVLNDDNGTTDVFAYNVSNQEITRLSVTDLGVEIPGTSSQPAVNSNGQFVLFQSDQDEDLVSSDDNGFADIFLVDTQCLLAPDGVTPGDQDSDSTDDCNDECPTDATKTAAGDCGCGVAETDTDSDGTPDCNDECDSDASKTEAGSCGCGIADTDSNNNGVTDCLEFTSGQRPRKPTVTYKRSAQNLRVIIPLDPPGFQYLIQVRKDGKIIRKKKTARTSTRFRMRGISGQVRVRYKVVNVTKFSRYRKIRLN